MPMMPNGNLTNGGGMARPAHIITPQNNHDGLLKEIQSGEEGFEEVGRVVGLSRDGRPPSD